MDQRRINLLLVSFVISAACLPYYGECQSGCDVTVDAGTDTTFCQGNQLVNLAAQINGNYLDARWEPLTGLSDPNQPTTQATVNNTITYIIQVRSRSSLNLITNGDFSQGDTGFTSEYIYGTGGTSGLLTSEGQYAIDDNAGKTHNRFADCTDHTTGTGKMMIVNASGTEDNFWCQTVTVNEGAIYDFSAWVTSVNDQNPAQLQFSIDGELLGSQFNASGDLCFWEEFYARWTAPASATVEICVVNVNLTPAGNDFAIDDIAFQEICIASDTVTLAVAELNADWNVPSTFCKNDDVVVLDDLLLNSATPGGEWTLDDEVVSALDPSNLEVGQYLLKYTVTQESCVLGNEQMIEILEAPYAGVPGSTHQFCLGDDTPALILSDDLQGEDPGGFWTETSVVKSPAGAFDAASSRLEIPMLPAGNYTFNYSVGANGPCGISENEIRIIIEALPEIDLGEDQALSCDQTKLTLGAEIPQNNAYNYLWTDEGGNSITTEKVITVDAPGTYNLLVTDSASGCESLDEITILDQINEISALVTTVDASCNGLNDGLIRIESTTGGSEPYLFSIDDQPFTGNNVFDNLSPGAYTITVMDSGGCTHSMETVIETPDDLQVDLLANKTSVNSGDSVLLRAVANRQLSQVTWDPTSINCPNCPQVVVRPVRSTTYLVQVSDENGCTASDQLEILVKRDVGIFIPNAFSPNEDGVNDLFYIHAGEGVRILNLQILDRWGNVVFQQSDFDPNDPGMAWDGHFRGKRVSSGVVVYGLEAEMPDGNTIILSGELAVIY